MSYHSRFRLLNSISCPSKSLIEQQSVSRNRLRYRLQPPLRHLVAAHAGPVRALQPLPQQGGLIASGGDDGTIRSWNPSTGSLVRDFGGTSRALETWATTENGLKRSEFLDVLGRLEQVNFWLLLVQFDDFELLVSCLCELSIYSRFLWEEIRRMG